MASSTIKWAKFAKPNDVHCIPKDIIIAGRGCYLNFTDTSTHFTRTYGANNAVKGEGVKCFTGHKTLPVFAFAELCIQPHIMVIHYPTFQKIADLSGECIEGYSELTFSDADYLVSLGSLPLFTLIVWNWRKGEMLSKMITGLASIHQIIRCSYTNPIMVAQMGVATTFLYMWTIFVSGKKYIMKKKELRVDRFTTPFSSLTWHSDGTLFVLDIIGNVYTVNNDYLLQCIITWPTPGTCLTCFTWYKGGLLVSGSNGKMIHFKKQNVWINAEEFKTEEPMKRLIVSSREMLIGVTINRNIVVYNQDEQIFENIKNRESRFTNFCLIYPVGEFIVTLTDQKYLTVWEVATGKMLWYVKKSKRAVTILKPDSDSASVEKFIGSDTSSLNILIQRGSLELQYSATCIAENPVYPYVGVTFTNGVYQMISIYDPDNPSPLTSVFLTRKSLNKIFFTKNGRMMAVGDTTTGEIFILEGYPGIKVTVEAYVMSKQQLCDFILIPSRTCLRIFALLVTSVNYKAGNRIVRYCAIKGKKDPKVKEFQLEEDMWYKSLHPTDRENRDRVFYAMPFGSKFLYELETRRGDSLIRITDKLNLGHQLKLIKLDFHGENMISFGYDGLVIVRTTQGLEPVCVVMPHHRKHGGVIKAYINPMLSHVISLGRDNVMCCTALNTVPFDEDKLNELKEILETPKLLLMFVKSKFTSIPIEYPGKTWLEAQSIIETERERKICMEEREAILTEFRVIQKEVRKLLYGNQTGPDNEKIPINYFDMDDELTNLKSIECDEQCKQTAEELELLIEAQDRVSRWLKVNCWDSMSTKGKAIWGIFMSTRVENYPLLPDDDRLDFIVQCIEEYRKIEQSITTGQFLAWQPIPRSQLEANLEEEPTIKDEKEAFLETLKEEEEEEREEEDIETITAFAGSLTHLFIEKSSQHYSQEQIHSYIQVEYETLLSLYENGKLKRYFNKQFDTIMSQKEREMKLLRERNDRLRYIIAELNFFNVNKWGLERIDISPVDPEWKAMEQPERIVTVADYEVPVTPYISPSEQALLDAKAAEEERIRLALLADDFRERALMKMMNGVLEMRWEDEIKKDVPKPKCMLEKEPEEFNEDDLRAVRDYEEKVKQLNSDREYYKLLLENEYGKLCNTLREGVRKFNGRLDDFLLVKIRIETAILQERLKVDMIRRRSARKLILNEEETNVFKQIQENDRELDEVLRLIPVIYEHLQECRGEIEAINARDKILEKNFKKDFQNATPVVSEQANKQMKRRPKTNIRNITSSTIVIELARCVSTNQRSLLINLCQDAVEFLKALDAVDMYVGIPTAIDELTYAKICQHRRYKIENELRARANALEVADAENTLHIYKKLLEQKREHTRKLKADVDKIRADKLENVHNNEILMVVNEGIVELPLTGSAIDFENAILIPKKEIEFVNRIILKNGRRKLKAMRDNMDHHRAILLMEWEHSKLRMTVADYKEHIKDIEGVTVTKDMQSYLKAMARGYTPEGSLSFEEELERLTQSYEKMLNEKKEKVQKIQKKIKAIKSDNKKLDQEISSINIDICDYNIKKDDTLEDREQELIKLRMTSLMKRAQLVKQLQDYHNKTLVLQTELELLRLKTYPTLNYKILT